MTETAASAPSVKYPILSDARQDAPENQPAPPRVEPQPFRELAGLVDRLIEETRFRADFQRAALRIGNQELALTRRLTGCAKGEAPKILKQALALPSAPHSLTTPAGPVNGKTRAHPLLHNSGDQLAASNGQGIAPKQSRTLTASPLLLINTICAKFEEAKKPLLDAQAEHEKRIKKLAVQLPCWKWCESVRGVGPLLFGLLVGEMGDPSRFHSVRGLWSRFGLHVVDGEIQRRTTDKEKAERFGFCPRRRALMHVLGECLLRSGDEYYRGVYDSRKAYELEREPELKPIVAHMRAMRFMQKRFLRELWLAWTGEKRLSGGAS